MDYAANFTPRVRLNYRVQGRDHALMARCAFDADEAGASATASKLMALVNIMAPQLYTDWVVLGFEWCLQDADIWLPLATPALPVFLGGAASPAGRAPAQAAAQLRYEARGTSGSRASYTIFGTNWMPGATAADDFRIGTSENPVIAAFVTGLTEISPQFFAVDGSSIIPKLYANVKYNDSILDDIRGV